MSKKVLFVFGTRPEAIKMAPVIQLARQAKGKLKPIICVTGQHRFLLDQALTQFKIKPDIDLNLMRPNQSLYDIISRVSQAMRDVYRKIRPDLVLVQGDTSTVFAASLACYYENIDLAHIEAGLRSGDNRNPFPEEINRRFVSLVAKYNFCPTPGAKQNLLSEGVKADKIFVTGNTVIDALGQVLKQLRRKPPRVAGLSFQSLQQPLVLITGHRRENFGPGIKRICTTIRSLARNYPGLFWIWAVHLNPQARKAVFAVLNNLANVRLIEPLPYREFVFLMDRAEFIISDSGGVQEEAPSLGKKVLVTRICTERPEAIKSGTSILVGTSPAKISQQVNKLLQAKKTRIRSNPFGDGRSAQRIIDVLVKGHCQQFH